MSETKIKFAGGYNGDRYSVTGYCVGATDYFIESKNSITAKVVFNSAKSNNINDVNVSFFDVSIFRNDEFVFSYSYDLNMKLRGNSNTYSLIDNLSVNVLFQLDERELDTLIPMIKNSTDHSFTITRFNNDCHTYYIRCKSQNPCVDEYIIKKFNDKFYFDECSLYRRNMSLNKALNHYSYLKFIELYYSLSDNDAYFYASGYYAGLFFVFNSDEHNIKYFFTKKNPDDTENTDEFDISDIKTLDEFCDKSFEITMAHILSDDYMVNGMNKVITDFGIDPHQDWKSFLHLFDMATI